MLFSDESRFVLHVKDRREYVWRREGERFAQCTIRETDAFGGGSVLVWAGISLDGKTDLHIVNGTMTGRRYIDEVLEPIVRPYAGAIGPDFILQDDNARPHRARIVDNFLQDEGIERMDWPSKSPDFNPIEHAWDILGRKAVAHVTETTTLQQFRVILQEEWQRIGQPQIRRLIQRMRRRCEASIAARGGHTPY